MREEFKRWLVDYPAKMVVGYAHIGKTPVEFFSADAPDCGWARRFMEHARQGDENNITAGDALEILRGME